MIGTTPSVLEVDGVVVRAAADQHQIAEEPERRLMLQGVTRHVGLEDAVAGGFSR